MTMDLDVVRKEFSSETAESYFNSSGSTLCPARVKDEVVSFMEALCSDSAEAFKRSQRAHERLRKNLAGLFGADPAEIALTHHTAEGASVIANGIDWREGDTILTLDREYPSTVYPWMHLESTKGVRCVLLQERDGRLDETEIAEAILRERPRLFAISAVEWNSGYRFDLEPIGRACREAGAFFFVDAAQAAGFCDIDVATADISAMAGSAWKWLFGPAGQGYLYLRRDLLETITPRFVGSHSVVNPTDYLDYDLTFRPDMRRFEYSTMNPSALVWFDAGVRFVLDLGLRAVREHVLPLQDEALRRLRTLGCETRGGCETSRRSGIIAFRHPRVPSAELARRMQREAGLFARERDGCVRLAFHVYTTPASVDRLLDFLEQA